MGGVRIDHVMGLFRQFWIPRGGGPADGAYVHLPHAELLALVCLEATRAGAFVVGEDLGTVQPEVRRDLAAVNVLGTKVWLFDPDVDEWPERNLGTVTTHDLPTVAGMLAGDDGGAAAGALAGLTGAGRGEAVALADVLVAVHGEIARSPAHLVLATADDLAGSRVRPNSPGTLARGDRADGAPWNWCHRLGTASADLLGRAPGADVVDALRAARPPV